GVSAWRARGAERAAVLHGGPAELHQAEGGERSGLPARREVLVGDALELAERHLLRVVHEDVERAVHLDHARDAALEALHLLDVAADRDRLAAAPHDLVAGALELAHGAPGRRDLGPFARERVCDALADALPRARHERHLAREHAPRAARRRRHAASDRPRAQATTRAARTRSDGRLCL